MLECEVARKLDTAVLIEADSAAHLSNRMAHAPSRDGFARGERTPPSRWTVRPKALSATSSRVLPAAPKRYRTAARAFNSNGYADLVIP